MPTETVTCSNLGVGQGAAWMHVPRMPSRCLKEPEVAYQGGAYAEPLPHSGLKSVAYLHTDSCFPKASISHQILHEFSKC